MAIDNTRPPTFTTPTSSPGPTATNVQTYLSPTVIPESPVIDYIKASLLAIRKAKTKTKQYLSGNSSYAHNIQEF